MTQVDGDIEVPEVLAVLDHLEDTNHNLAVLHVELVAEEEPGLWPVGPGVAGGGGQAHGPVTLAEDCLKISREALKINEISKETCQKSFSYLTTFHIFSLSEELSKESLC